MIKSRLYSGSDGYPLPHPTKILFLLPVPSTRIFLHFRVQGSSYTCCFQSRIISTMMPANQLRRKRNSLKIVKIERNAEHKPTHLQFRMDIWHYSSFLFMSFGNIVLKTLCGQSSLGHRLTFSVIFIWKVVFPLTVKSGTMLLFCHEAIFVRNLRTFRPKNTENLYIIDALA